MKKFILKEVTKKAGNNGLILSMKIRDVQKSMKNCRKRLVSCKKDLTYYYDCFDRNLKLYQKWVKGESIQDANALHHIKLSDERLTRLIADTRKRIRNEVKLLYRLRILNKELFEKLLNETNAQHDKRQVIELNRDQARKVFTELYSLFDSKQNFAKVCINI